MSSKKTSNELKTAGLRARSTRASMAICLAIGLMIAQSAMVASAYQCSYSLAFDAQLVSKAAGDYSIGVIAGAGCGWTASSNDSWITITSGSSGTGNGTVNYSVTENTGGTRTGTMTIAGITFYVFQSASTPNCDFLFISPTTNNSVPVGGGSYSFVITGATQTECSWTASSNVSWITITSGSSGTGNATVNYSVASNGTGANRTGKITVSGFGASQIHTVKQLH